MLRVHALEAFYGTSQALFGMELAVDAGEVVTLMGRNGMGKTTTVSAIMGLLPARSGVVEFEGNRVDQLPSFLPRSAGHILSWRSGLSRGLELLQSRRSKGGRTFSPGGPH